MGVFNLVTGDFNNDGCLDLASTSKHLMYGTLLVNKISWQTEILSNLVKSGGTNANCASAVADLATCNAASLQNTCTVKNGGNNADCAAAFADAATCTAATASGGSGIK